MPGAEIVQSGLIEQVAQAGLVIQGVLGLLGTASLACWAIILAKTGTLGSARRANAGFVGAFWQAKSLDEVFDQIEKFPRSPVAAVFKSGFRELKKLSMSDRTGSGTAEIENIQRALSRAAQVEISNLERYIGWLATTASAAPFVGLFGTVWGIMSSFRDIGSTGTANLAVVAPGISEALVATAIGLGAAIPAVVFYNLFVGRIRRIAADIDCFSNDFVNLVQRSLMAGRKK